MNKILLVSVSVIFLALFAGLMYYKNQYEKAIFELGETKKSIEIQNESIKQNALELEYYANKLENINKNIENRYNNVKTTHKDCESELLEVKKILETFYTR